MTSQIRRASASIPSNIAEGSARGTSKDFISFLRVALGSLRELETQLLLSVDIELIDTESIVGMIEAIGSISYLLQRLISSQSASS